MTTGKLDGDLLSLRDSLSRGDTMETSEDLMARARELVLQLQAAGHSPSDIAEKLNGRVSSRTIYRWAKGEHAPQQRSDLIALEKLAEGLTA